jgi:glycosyltransferase involved in cell wall biosynthesis
MKVLNVISTLDPVTGGGAAERTLKLSQAFLEADVECSIITLDIGIAGKSFTKLPEFKNIHVVVYPSLFKRFPIPKIRFSEICKEVKSVDIVHLMGHWSILNALVYFAVRICNKPYVVCPAGALPIFGRSKLLKKIYNWVIGHSIIRKASGWIAITSAEFVQFESYGITASQVIVIPNGVSVEDFPQVDVETYKRDIGLGGKPLILFMGRLNSIKGPDLLLQAFALVKDRISEFHLVFAGPDEGMKSVLIEIAKQNNISEHVHFLGYVGLEDKSAVYRMANLLVVPSRQEAMSIVALEAAACGTPVMLTDQCGFNEVKSICSSFEVTADISGIADGLIILLKESEKLKKKSILLKEFVLKKYKWRLIINIYIELYKKILTSEKG